MRDLTSLPIELLLVILDRFEYASDVNALAQTCRRFHDLANSRYLYSYFAQTCSPQGLQRIADICNRESLRKMLESQVDIDQFYTGSEEDHTLRDFTSLLLNYCEPAFLLDFTNGRKQLFQVALREGHLEFLKAWLADALARPSSTSQPLGKLMQRVAAEGTLPFLQYLLETGFRDTDPSSAPLSHAAKRGDMEMVETLLEAGTDANQVHVEARPPGQPLTAIQMAASHGHHEIVRRLMREVGRRRHYHAREMYDLVSRGGGQKQAAVLMMDGLGKRLEALQPPLSDQARSYFIVCGAAAGDEGVIRCLLQMTDHRESIWRREDTYWALQHAAISGHIEVVKLLLDEVTEVVPTQLFQACAFAARGAIESQDVGLPILVELLDRGGEDFIEDYGLTMLYASLTTGNKEACKLLVERNALLNCRWKLKHFIREPILRAAMQAGQLSLFWQALKHAHIWPAVGEDRRSKTVEILGLAAYRGSVDTFKQVLSHCAVFLDPKDPAYDTVLVSAVLGRHPETVQLFLEAGFEVNGLYPRTHGKSASLLYLAIRNPPFGGVPSKEESVTLARLLLRHGANVNLLSWKGDTALACAMEQRSEELVELLLETNDIDPLLQGGYRLSAVQRALVAYPANPKYLRLLLTKVSIHDPRLQDLTHRLGARAQVWLETPPSSDLRDELQRWRAIWLDAEKSEEDSVEQSDSTPKPLQAMPRNNLWWTQFLALKEMRCYYWRAISPVPDL
ncbi:hypothetical protein ASPACDRAFT_48560 [Aspergillus aculeatus ATCC 16872]|uniref:F-box domain-containing protein n=1 Tax=Aspergillus aculeatus (strain ATCC 16872 / CBS 172.66 / WB 5094) TaxID=690307 RepID=A0A1L9WEY3_ASPA1|nr:uncharacterized protein ASPACDRAFT_48560 [Aspergillus aculeatus ATCC 16872]OJJ94731.1 hypothetical protein ASPACDRAFT_48560 [Aspergillus aculeatus ATCC 16872]